MSLRLRLVSLTGAVLLIAMALSTLVAGYHAKKVLSAELRSGLIGAEQTVTSAFEDLPRSQHQVKDLRQLVFTFNGNRHVRAVLLDNDFRPAEVSTPTAPGSRAPAWFTKFLGGPPKDLMIRVPRGAQGYAAIRLEPVESTDVDSAWEDFCEVVMVLAASTGLGLGVVYLVITAAFRPLSALLAEFAKIGTGDYSARLQERGPSELLSLRRGFNEMAGQLAATTARNRHLTEQLLTLQDEERADIARDLHDEIGPHLFGVAMDAEMISKLTALGDYDAIFEPVGSIKRAVQHMQQEVRELLGRLRPTPVTEFGLNAALVELARYWEARRPDITFKLDLPQDGETLSAAVKEAVYRIIQEAAANAVRHAEPSSVHIRMEMQNATDLVVMIFDDGVERQRRLRTDGLGLVGMRERASLLGGTVVVGKTAGAPGWSVVARLPIAPAANDRPAEAAA